MDYASWEQQWSNERHGYLYTFKAAWHDIAWIDHRSSGDPNDQRAHMFKKIIRFFRSTPVDARTLAIDAVRISKPFAKRLRLEADIDASACAVLTIQYPKILRGHFAVLGDGHRNCIGELSASDMRELAGALVQVADFIDKREPFPLFENSTTTLPNELNNEQKNA